MPSFESGRSPARAAQETRAGLAAAALAALVGAACERIPKAGDHQRHYASVYDRLHDQDPRGRTPAEVILSTLPISPEGTSRPAAELAILSVEGHRGVGATMEQLNQLARTTYGNKIWDTREVLNPSGGTYLNHTVIPFSATEPEAINGHRVTLSYEFTRTDIFTKHPTQTTSRREGALIAQRTTLGVSPETVARGPGPILRQQAATGADYTAALNEALTQIARPPGADEIEADFRRMRAAASLRQDLDDGAQCSVINSQELGQAHYCATRTQRQRQLVIDDIQQTRAADGSVRVSVLYHDPSAPVPDVIARPGT